MKKFSPRPVFGGKLDELLFCLKMSNRNVVRFARSFLILVSLKQTWLLFSGMEKMNVFFIYIRKYTPLHILSVCIYAQISLAA